MKVIDILETVQYVVDRRGQQTAVLLDLSTWRSLQQILEDMQEDERLGERMLAVQGDEKLDGEAAQEAYRAYRNQAHIAPTRDLSSVSINA